MIKAALKHLSVIVALVAVRIALRDGDFYAMNFGKAHYREINKRLVFFGLKGMGILNYKSEELSGEKHFLEKHLHTHANPGDIIVDVGANRGQFARLALKSSPLVSVIAFEPHPKACQNFDNNMRGLEDRCTLIRKGASHTNGEAYIYDYSNNPGSEHATMTKDVIEKLNGSGCSEKTQINLTTLDLELQRIKEKIRLIKIDTEGHELSVIRGAQATINRHRPSAIIIEFNEMNALSGTHYHEIQGAIGSNYRPYRLLPGGALLSLSLERPLWTEIYAYQNLVFLLDEQACPS